MKKLLLLFLLFAPLLSFGQYLPYSEGKLTFQRIDTVSNSKKDKIFNAAKTWLVNSVGSAKQVIEMEDKEEGRIMGKFYYESKKRSDTSTRVFTFRNKCTFQIDCKDSKVRIKLYDFFTRPVVVLPHSTEGDLMSDADMFSVDKPLQTLIDKGIDGQEIYRRWEHLAVASQSVIDGFTDYIKTANEGSVSV